MLKLREGWEVREEYDTEKRWVIPTGADFEHAYAVIDFNAEVHAYPFGADEAVFVGTIEAAHEHFLSVGSQSPWYDVPDDARVTGPVVSYDAPGELATLRADNNARGVLIEQLREKIVSMEANMQELMDESDKYMRERDEARQERDIANSEIIALRGETHRALDKLDNVRCDRDKHFAAYQRTLRALNAALGEP